MLPSLFRKRLPPHEDDLARTVQNLLPADLKVLDFSLIQKKSERFVYSARSDQGKVVVKVFLGSEAWTTDWTLKLMPLIDCLRPPEMIFAEPGPVSGLGCSLSFFVARWIEGEHFDYGDRIHSPRLAESLARLHSIVRDTNSPPYPTTGPLAQEREVPGSVDREQLTSSIRSISTALRRPGKYDLQHHEAELLSIINRLYEEEGAPSLIHGSPIQHHTFVESDGTIRFIDLDNMQFAPPEFELARYVCRTVPRQKRYPWLCDEVRPDTPFTPTPFEEAYFASRGATHWERWKRHRSGLLVAAAFLDLGLRLGLLKRDRLYQPDGPKYVDRKVKTWWGNYLRVYEASTGYWEPGETPMET